MKQEAGKKTMKWLIPVIIVVLLLIGGGVAAALLLGNGDQQAEPAADPAGRADIYWNIDRAQFIDPATSLSIREPGEDGLYRMRFAFDGEQVELTITDKKLVNRIDMLDFMSLVVDEGGNVTDCKPAGEVCTIAAENFYVQKQEGNVITTNSSAALNGMAVDYTVSEMTGIYNVSARSEFVGAVDEVEPMDKVIVLQNAAGDTTHIFIVERPVESDVYWRVGQFYANKETTRVPDESGVYSILFAVNGEQVTLKCKLKDIVTKIDAVDNNIQAMGLVFDEEGFIIDTMTSALAIRGALVSNQFDVTEINGTHFKTQRMLPSSNQGQTWEGDMSPTCKIYEVSGTADFVGQEVSDLRVTDRVYVLTNTTGQAEIIFITNRMLPDHDLYWLATRYYDNAAQTTTQKPAADGYWYMEFVVHGQLVTLRSNDLDIVNQIQAPTTKAMGLDLDGDVITKVYHYVNITGGWVVAGSSYVDSINGPIVNTSYANGSTSTFVMSADCEVMNVCFESPKVMGEYTTLQVGDRVVPIRNAQGEVVVIYVNLRKVDAPVYWSLTRSYNSTKKETSRTPLATGDWKGYYEFRVTTDGKRPIKVYTKSKELASKFDSKSPQAVGLKLNGKIITDVYGAGACTGGGNMANYCHVEYWENEEPDENGISRFYAKYRATGNGTTVQFDENTRFFNVSVTASYVGIEESGVRLDDRITVFTNRKGIAELVYIVERPFYCEPYYNMEQRYASGSTTRQPNEEGYYVFDKIVHKGELITLKTKDKDVATEVDSYAIGMAMHVSNGIVTRAFGIPNTANYGNNVAPNFDITAINGRQITLTRMRPSAPNQGDVETVTITSSCKFYDVSPYAEKPGAVVTPQVGDRVVIYQDNDNKVGTIGFVTMRHTREAGAFGYCDHCDKEVYWNHWEGSFAANANKEKDNDTVHYYMAADRKLSTQVLAGNDKQSVMHAILDLNGKTLESDQRALGAWYGATLYVLDSSKDQTGTVIGRGAKVNVEEKPRGDGAGVVLTTRGGSITIYGGNWKVAEDHNPISNGGILNAFSHADFKGGTITINGGKFYGTDVTENGGAVSCNTGSIVINGGEFFGGEAANIGGTLHSATKLVLNGGTIHGGKANYGATLSMPNLVMNGGTVESGEAKQLGDCMYISSSFKAEINGGTVEDIWINSTWDQNKAYVKISGQPVIKNIDIATGKLIDATGITGGKVAVNASGAFTTEFASEAAAKAAAQYFTSSSDLGTVDVQGKQLVMGIYRCLYGHTAEDHKTVSCDSEILTWTLWTSTTSLPTSTGNYILSKDVTTSGQTSIGGADVILDLNGCDVTYKIPTARTQNFRVFYINDNLHKNGKEAGTTHGSLIITDNSTDDVTKQGTVSSILPEYAANYADEPKWKEEADKAVVATIEAEAKAAALLKGEEGSAEYEAEYAAQYEAIYAEKYETLVAEYIENLLKGYKNTHDAGASGMLVHVAHGNFALMGGNLDASNLTIKAAGTAIATGARLETMNADAQNVVILGGTVSGGTTTKSGGAISIAAGTSMTMTGGTVNGGVLDGAAVHGAAIFSAGEVTVSGGTVNGGTGATNSGSIYAEGDAAVITIDGDAVINAGKATNGDNMYVRFGTWTIGGNAKVNGGVSVSKASLTITGAPTIVKEAGGSEYSLKLATSDKLITFQDLTEGAKIAITGLGKFSTAGDKDIYQQWIDAGYFFAEAEGKAVVVQGGALSVADADAVDMIYCVYGHLNHDNVDCDEPLLTWSKWSDLTKLPTAAGNYYVAAGSTLNLTSNYNVITDGVDTQINLDLRGSTVLAANKSNVRMLLVRTGNNGGYTITSTVGQAKIKTTSTSLDYPNYNGGLIYCYNGLVRVINTDLDASSLVTNKNIGSVVYAVNNNGFVGQFAAENSTITGGAAANNEAVHNSAGCTMTLTNVTVGKVENYGFMNIADSEMGELFHNATGKNLTLTGVVKIANMRTGHVDCSIDCTGLTDGSELVVSKGIYKFADANAAQAAVTSGMLQVAEGYELKASGENAYKVFEQPKMYCVYGHTEHIGENANCAEPIVEWTKWEETNKMPDVSGNYYFADDAVISLNGQSNTVKTTEVLEIRVDLRGAQVSTKNDTRTIMLKGAAGSFYTITDTKGGASMKTTVASSNISGGAAMLYANIGEIRVIGVEIDSTSITTNTQANSVGIALATGHLIFEDCVIKGGASSNGVAIYHTPAADASVKNLVVKNTTIEGGVMVNGSALRVQLDGVVKLLPGNGTFGLKGTAAAAEFNCTKLAEGSKIVAANCNYSFADAAAAQAAIDNEVIVPVEGMFANLKGSVVTISEQQAAPEKTQYCVYGHEKHEGETASCTEPILTWTEWTDMGKLPTAAGNYYVAAGSTITLTTNTNVITDGVDTQINLDLRGGTIVAPNKDHMRLLLVRVGNNGGYTITSTAGQAKIKTATATLTESSAINGGLFYCYNGLTRIINTDLDTTSLTNNPNQASVAYVTNYNGYIGKLEIENSTITGGVAANNNAIYNNTGDVVLTNVTVNGGIQTVANATATGSVTIADSTINGKVYAPGYWSKDASAYVYPVMSAKDSTFTGLVENSAVFTVENCEFAELYHNATGANLKLSGVVKAAKMYTNHEDCSIDCANLAAGSELVVSKGIYKFADATAAEAAVTSGLLKVATNFELKASGTSAYKVHERIVERTVYCVYGHETHDGVDCAEPILTWTKWEDMTKLPTAAGNYYVAAGSTMELTSYYNFMSAEAVQVNLDLRGSTVKTSGNTGHRMLLVRTAVDGGYTITSTAGQAKLMTTATTLNGNYAMNGGLLYCYQGKVRIINTDLDASSLTNNAENHGSAVFVQATDTYKGEFAAENATIIGGDADGDNAIYALGTNVTLTNTTVNGGVYAKVAALTLTGSTVNGKINNGGSTMVTITDSSATELFHNGGKANIALNGVVKIDALSTYHPDATIPCDGLADGSKIGLFGGACGFADPQAALDGGMIAAAKGAVITVNTTDKVVKVTGRTYCINGHYADTTGTCAVEGCGQEILTWTPKAANITSLPTTAGNYYLPDYANVKLTAQAGATNASTKYDVRVDLRGANVSLTNNRAVILRGTSDSQFTITSTLGQAKMKNTNTEVTDNNNAPMIYAYVGTVNVSNVDLDASAITSSTWTSGTVVYIPKTGSFRAENCTITGASVNAPAIHAAHANEATSGTLVLKNTTVNGGLYITGSGVKMTLEGVVKLLASASNTYGFKGGAAAAEVNCRLLAEGSEIQAANCNFSFADAAKATAANGTIIKPAAGFKVVVRDGYDNQLNVQTLV